MNRMRCIASFLAVAGAPLCLGADELPLSVRVHNFVVNPSTGPTTTITVRNPQAGPFQGSLTARFPDGWQVTPKSHELHLAAGETKALPFAVEKAVETRATNAYTVVVAIDGGGVTHAQTQVVVWASAPYFKPKIDGNAKEWKDAVPIRWTTGDKHTVVSLYWNRKQFCVLARVEEDRLIGLGKRSADNGMDAIQFAVAPAGAVTGKEDADKSARHEFLVADAGRMWGRDRCFRLMNPDVELNTAQETRELDSLEFKDAEVAVKRSGKTTVYEVAVPFKAMPELRPTPGREFCFSLLVHDPDGTGLRDLGVLMNLDESGRNPLAWSSWKHVKWGEKPPLDNKVEFGFCSSIH